jgi:hypothetical protein
MTSTDVSTAVPPLSHYGLYPNVAAQKFVDAPCPEFADAGGVEKLFGIRRSLAFRLLADNEIRGVSIRQRGRIRGKRLFDCASIREFLSRNVDRGPECKPTSGTEEENAPAEAEPPVTDHQPTAAKKDLTW